MRVTLAVIHLLALGIGLGAIYARARLANQLRSGTDTLKATFTADTWWGVAAFLWITTGLWRAFGSLEKTSAYYWNNHVFWAKMGLLALVIALEIWPMLTLVKWRRSSARNTLDTAAVVRRGPVIARISDVQLLLSVGMVVAAVLMARGYGLR